MIQFLYEKAHLQNLNYEIHKSSQIRGIRQFVCCSIFPAARLTKIAFDNIYFCDISFEYKWMETYFYMKNT